MIKEEQCLVFITLSIQLTYMKPATQELLQALNPQGLFHGVMMSVAWVACQQLALWALYFRNRSRIAIYIHAASMVTLVLLTSIAATQIIVYKGLQVITKTWFHTLLGMIVSCLVPIVLGFGFITKVQQNSSIVRPITLERTKMVHIISGWAIISLSRIPLYTQWVTKQPTVFFTLFIFDIVAHSFYFYKKQFQARLENSSIVNYKQNVLKIRDEIWIRQIKNYRELQIFHGDYFIFADFVYKLSPLLTIHPGGFQIINEIRGREVDRFLFGVQSLEKFDMIQRVSHTASSIKMAGQPIARIQRPKIYSLMEEENEAKICATNFYQSSKRIYTIYLRAKDKRSRNFKYGGYTDISQLGKYFALTVGNKKTRLYTMVNFLQNRTVKLVEEVTKGRIFSKKQKQILSQHGYTEQMHNNSIVNWQQGKKSEDDSSTFDQEVVNVSQFKFGIQDQNILEVSSNNSGWLQDKKLCIPLLMKKYDQGQLTSQLLTKSFKGDIKISCPRGRGLCLQDIPQNGNTIKVIMLSGGTGIFPFADTIDLAFKQLLIQKQLMDEKQNSLRNSIIRSDSVLQTKPFKNFEFTLYISVPTMQEIHPITLFQCEFLALHEKMKVYIKSSKIVDERISLQQRYPNIKISDHRYQKILRQINPDEISRVYMCGPTRMTKALINQLENLQWSPSKYVVL